MDVGFIGTGSMGSILIDAFISSGTFSADHVTIFNRTRAKAETIASKFGTRISASIEDVILSSDAIFICVRPNDYETVLRALQLNSHKNQTIISITSAILLEDLERALPCKIIKMIPSITNAALSGASLIMYSNRLNQDERKLWNQIFSSISQPREIDEKYIRVSSDLTSCGPAFVSLLLQKMIEAASLHTGIQKELATQLVTDMMIGYGRLFSNGNFTLETLQERVCVPGGVTGVGLNVIREELGPLFEHLFQKTHEKFQQDLEENKEWLKNIIH